MKLIENNNEFVIRERTSLKGNASDITNLNISSELYHQIKESDSSRILIEKIIYDKDIKRYVTIFLEYNHEKFLILQRGAGKNKGKSYRLRLDSSNLLEIKKSKSIILNKIMENKSPEVDFFMKTYVDSFKMSLDEMSRS